MVEEEEEEESKTEVGHGPDQVQVLLRTYIGEAGSQDPLRPPQLLNCIKTTKKSPCK